MKNTATPNLVPSNDVMRRLGYRNRASFLDFIRREGLPFYRIARRKIMFDPVEVEEWLESRKIGGRKR